MNEEKTNEEIIEECEKKKEEYFSGWQREKADFINYKKKELERLEEILFTAREGLFLEIIPVLDNFNLAEKSIEGEKDNNIKGLLLIKKQLEDALKAMGLEEITSVGQKFDPAIHEAVGEIEQENTEPGIIVEEIEKGYELNGKVIRPAKIKVSK